MNRIDWNRIEQFARSASDMKEMPDYLYMEGSLNVPIPRGRPLPDELYSVTSSIEGIMRQSFPNLQVTGEESVNTQFTKPSSLRYFGQIYGSDDNGIVTITGLSGFEPDPVFDFDALLTFFSVWPLGEYHQQTSSALQGMWQYIRGFDSLFGIDDRVPSSRHGNQAILLVKKGKFFAIGQYAIEEAALPVEPKCSAFLGNGIFLG